MMKRGFAAALFVAMLPVSAAQADMHIDLGGYDLSYIVYADNDERSTAAAGDHLHKLDFRHDTEIWFNGERTFDNGLTIGVQSELKLFNESGDHSVNTLTAAGQDPSQTDAVYGYLKGSFGEFRLGAQDGAAYALQVAAPGADPNVDGLRVWIQGWNLDVWDDGIENASIAPAGTTLRLDYDNADYGKTDRLLYLTPEWQGFQAGISYAPRAGQNAVNDAFAGMSPDDRPRRAEHILDLAARYEGDAGPLRVKASAIWSGSRNEVDTAVGTRGSDDIRTWDLGLTLGWRDFSLGGALMGTTTGTSGPDSNVNIWVAGAAWDHGPWHLGASVYDFTLDSNGFGLGLADDIELRRYTAGGGFTAAPGVTFRGTVSRLDVDNGANSARDPQQTQVTLGTEIWF